MNQRQLKMYMDVRPYMSHSQAISYINGQPFMSRRDALLLVHSLRGGIEPNIKFAVTPYVAPPRKKVNIPTEVSQFFRPDKPAEISGEFAPRRKLVIPTNLEQAISSLYSNRVMSNNPEKKEAIQELIATLPPPIAPPMIEVPKYQPRIIPDVPAGAPMAMPTKKDLLKELKDYKEGIEYLKEICPLIRRTYNRRKPRRK